MRTFRVVVNGSEYNVEIEELGVAAAPASPAPAAPQPVAAQAPAAQAQPAPSKPAAEQPSVSGGVQAPMPGTVLETCVAKGDKVTKGQKLLILEAMKMENEIQAPGDGVIQDLLVEKGASVNAGDVLITIA